MGTELRKEQFEQAEAESRTVRETAGIQAARQYAHGGEDHVSSKHCHVMSSLERGVLEHDAFGRAAAPVTVRAHIARVRHLALREVVVRIVCARARIESPSVVSAD